MCHSTCSADSCNPTDDDQRALEAQMDGAINALVTSPGYTPPDTSHWRHDDPVAVERRRKQDKIRDRAARRRLAMATPRPVVRVHVALPVRRDPARRVQHASGVGAEDDGDPDPALAPPAPLTAPVAGFFIAARLPHNHAALTVAVCQ